MAGPSLCLALADAEATERLGAALAACTPAGACVYLHGNLGAGKTALVRGFLHALGHQGAVKSPTYTLVEPYQVDSHTINHFDLYRLADPEELEFLGIRDYFNGDTICLIEWPERGAGLLPGADLLIDIAYALPGREVEIQAKTPMGEEIRACLTGFSSH